MPKPYSLDLRERVVRYVGEGHSRRAAAAHFRVSVSFVVNLVKAVRVRGSLAPKAQRRTPPRQARTASGVSFGEGRREGRHHHDGAGGRTGRRHLREGRSRLAFPLAHPSAIASKNVCPAPSARGLPRLLADQSASTYPASRSFLRP